MQIPHYKNDIKRILKFPSIVTSFDVTHLTSGSLFISCFSVRPDLELQAFKMFQ